MLLQLKFTAPTTATITPGARVINKFFRDHGHLSVTTEIF
jgi:hypothetical protein